MEAHPVLSFI